MSDKQYTVRPIRGRYLVDGPGSDGVPLATKAQAEAIANLMNVAYEQCVGAQLEFERLYREECDETERLRREATVAADQRAALTDQKWKLVQERDAALEDVKDYRILCEQVKAQRAALAWAQPAACSVLCPSTGVAGVPIPCLPECVSAKACLEAEASIPQGEGQGCR